MITEGLRSGIHNIFLNKGEILRLNRTQGHYIGLSAEQVFNFFGHSNKVQSHGAGDLYADINITFFSSLTSCIGAKYTQTAPTCRGTEAASDKRLYERPACR